MKIYILKISVIAFITAFLLGGDYISCFANNTCCCKDENANAGSGLVKKDMSCCASMGAADSHVYLKFDSNVLNEPISKKYINQSTEGNFVVVYPPSVSVYAGGVSPPALLLYSDLNIVNSVLRI